MKRFLPSFVAFFSFYSVACFAQDFATMSFGIQALRDYADSSHGNQGWLYRIDVKDKNSLRKIAEVLDDHGIPKQFDRDGQLWIAPLTSEAVPTNSGVHNLDAIAEQLRRTGVNLKPNWLKPATKSDFTVLAEMSDIPTEGHPLPVTLPDEVKRAAAVLDNSKLARLGDIPYAEALKRATALNNLLSTSDGRRLADSLEPVFLRANMRSFSDHIDTIIDVTKRSRKLSNEISPRGRKTWLNRVITHRPELKEPLGIVSRYIKKLGRFNKYSKEVALRHTLPALGALGVLSYASDAEAYLSSDNANDAHFSEGLDDGLSTHPSELKRNAESTMKSASSQEALEVKHE